jgi:hypothetical protein
VSGWRLKLFAHEGHSIGFFNVTYVADILHCVVAGMLIAGGVRGIVL